VLNPENWEEDFLIMPFEGKSRYQHKNAPKNQTDNVNSQLVDLNPPSDPTPALTPIPTMDQTLTSTISSKAGSSTQNHNSTSASTVNADANHTNQVTGEAANLQGELDALRRDNRELELQLEHSWDIKSSSSDEEDKSESSSVHSHISPNEDRLHMSDIQD
jgi:hypothetical protein